LQDRQIPAVTICVAHSADLSDQHIRF
jgi:hypothetical protein